MEYNKFIYKINKYKSYQRDSDKKRKEHYQKKIDFYLNKIDEIINNKNIKNNKNSKNSKHYNKYQNGGAFTNDDLMQFLEPTTRELNEHLDKKANITVFKTEQQKYEENHKKIIKFLDDLLDANNLLNELNAENDKKIEKIKIQMETMEETYRKDIQEKLQRIKAKVDAQKKLSFEDIMTKYKL